MKKPTKSTIETTKTVIIAVLLSLAVGTALGMNYQSKVDKPTANQVVELKR